MWTRLANENTDSVGADCKPTPFCLAIGLGPPPAPLLCIGVDSYLQDSVKSIGDQIGVDHIDREADWPHILHKQTRFYNVALRVPNMRWGRRCWDCSKHVRTRSTARQLLWCCMLHGSLRLPPSLPSTNPSSFPAALPPLSPPLPPIFR